MKKFFAVFVILFLCALITHAQDTIRTRRDTIIGKVFELGIDEIKYKSFDNLNGPLIVIDKRDVIEITYENGKKTLLGVDQYDANPEVEIRNKTHCIKFEFLSPLTNDIAFGYETMLKIGMNLEFKIGIIGPGFVKTTEPEMNGSGVFLKAGIKFLTSPTYYQKGVKFAHALKGFYIKPEIIYSAFTTDQPIYDSNQYYQITAFETVSYSSGALNIIFGKQHILGNAISIDYYFGIGYGFQKNDAPESVYNDYEVSYCYSHAFNDNGSALMFTGGITLGVPF